MLSQNKNLSKTRLMSARQCLKRLHLEAFRPELAVLSRQSRTAFATGQQIGEVARNLYGSEDSVLIAYAAGVSHAIRKTEQLLRQRKKSPIFEATLVFSGVLVRLDVLLPVADGWRIIEVKSSGSLKEEHAFDCAVQSWVFRGLGYRQSSIALAHVNTEFIYPGGDDYQGLLIEVEVTDAVEKLLPGVGQWAKTARDTLCGEEPVVAVGAQCNTPYECPFTGHCWPAAAYPVQTLPRASKAKLGRLIALGFTDLRDVPSAELSDRQLWVQRVSRSGVAELLPGARRFAAGLGYPRYYLDFETIAPAMPRWPGTRPYEVLPVQWSCHYEATAGQRPQHAEFLDLSGDPPMRRLAESLLRVLGKDGPVLTYSSYEQVVIDGLRLRFPDLSEGLGAIIGRLVDLQPLVQSNYYHPSMAGSWSLKAVLPTIAPEMDYTELGEIQDGTAASEGYLEAIEASISESRRSEIQEQLLRYCAFDTEAMWRLVQFFAAQDAPSDPS